MEVVVGQLGLIERLIWTRLTSAVKFPSINPLPTVKLNLDKYCSVFKDDNLTLPFTNFPAQQPTRAASTKIRNATGKVISFRVSFETRTRTQRRSQMRKRFACFPILLFACAQFASIVHAVIPPIISFGDTQIQVRPPLTF
jgi:hypothetical protein